MIKKVVLAFIIFALAETSLYAVETQDLAAFNSCMQACYKKSDSLYTALSITSFAGYIAAAVGGKGASGGNRYFDSTGRERNLTEPRYSHCYSSCKYENPNFDTTKDGDIHPKYDNSLYNYLNRHKQVK